MGSPTGIGTVALVCPECGERIRAPRGDVLFTCARCRRVSEVGPRGLETVPCTWAAPGEADLRLAFWCFRTHVAYSGVDVDAVDHLSKMVSPDRVYVPAFRQRSALVFGDMGLLMTYKPPDLEPTAPGFFAGATLGSAEAARLVEPMVLWRADHIRDVTGIEASVRVERVEVAAIPAGDEGERIVDLTGGREWPAAAFLDLEALRWKPA
jgi:hypothetical protein